MKKFWRAGDRSRAICEECGAVETRFEYRTYSLERPRVDVPDVLVAVCTTCDRTVGVPYQSSPRLNEARKVAEAPLEARIPRHLDDVLAVVASHYGRNDSEFRGVIVRYYLHALAESSTFARHVRALAMGDLGQGSADERLSLKIQRPVLSRAWETARSAGMRSRTEMVKGAIIAAAEDLEGRRGKKRRETLAEMAASV
ncbi:MAG TPA: hypothetical protein VF006_14505 [Longimicrobium sp.]